jgi:hypothetical protein
MKIERPMDTLSPFFERFFVLGGLGGFRQKNLQNQDTMQLKAGSLGFDVVIPGVHLPEFFFFIYGSSCLRFRPWHHVMFAKPFNSLPNSFLMRSISERWKSRSKLSSIQN